MKSLKHQNTLGIYSPRAGGFKFLSFHPEPWENGIQFDKQHIFSSWLVQPPTSVAMKYWIFVMLVNCSQFIGPWIGCKPSLSTSHPGFWGIDPNIPRFGGLPVKLVGTDFLGQEFFVPTHLQICGVLYPKEALKLSTTKLPSLSIPSRESVIPSWVFLNSCVYMDVSENSGFSPQNIHFE